MPKEDTSSVSENLYDSGDNNVLMLFRVMKGEMMKRFTCYSIDLLFEGDTGF